MATLLSTHSTPVFNIKHSDQLFYEQYEFGLKFFLPEFSCFRSVDVNLSHEDLKNYIVQRHAWRCQNRTRWVNFGGNWNTKTLQPEDLERERNGLILAVDAIAPYLADLKIVTSRNWGYLYSNNLAGLQNISQCSVIRGSTFTRVIINRPRHTVLLEDSKYQSRTYLKERVLTVDQKERIANFLSKQADIRLSPSLQRWITRADRHTVRHFFFDHDGDGITLMLEMLNPGIIRKTMPVLKVNN